MTKILSKIAMTLFTLAVIVSLSFGVYTVFKHKNLEQKNSQEQSRADANKDTAESQLLAKKDSDNDGLTAADEQKWGTDPENPDSDSDGYLDGEEVKNGYDPLIPSPNDKIVVATSPANSEPQVAGQNTDNSNAESATPPQAPNLTQRFLTQVKGKVAGSSTVSEDLVKDELKKFLESQNTQEALPQISNTEVNISYGTGKEAFQKYLEDIKQSSKSLQARATYEYAFDKILKEKNPKEFDNLLQALEGEEKRIENIEVPIEALNLHKMTIGYFKKVTEILKEFRENYQKDPVQSMAAILKIQSLGSSADQIEAEKSTLEKKFGL